MKKLYILLLLYSVLSFASDRDAVKTYRENRVTASTGDTFTVKLTVDVPKDFTSSNIRKNELKTRSLSEEQYNNNQSSDICIHVSSKQENDGTCTTVDLPCSSSDTERKYSLLKIAMKELGANLAHADVTTYASIGVACISELDSMKNTLDHKIEMDKKKEELAAAKERYCDLTSQVTRDMKSRSKQGDYLAELERENEALKQEVKRLKE